MNNDEDYLIYVTVPAAGESVTEVTVAKWHVADGDYVTEGSKLATLDSKKVYQEIEAGAAGEISIVAEAGATLKIGERIASIKVDSVETAKRLNLEAEPESKGSEEGSPEGGNEGSKAVLKLIALVGILFFAVKYGQPLLNQIAEKSNEALDNSKETEELVQSTTAESLDQAVDQATQSSDVRITSGYEAWEPEIREQLDQWVGEGKSYELTAIGVHMDKSKMEIRYREIDGSVATPRKLKLLPDGIDDRFIFESPDGKEFLVYPPRKDG